MKIEIDQSGKIENTNKPTVLAFSNSKFQTLIISGRDKRQIQKLFRYVGSPKLFIIKTFALLIFLLTKDSIRQIGQIFIDREYPGYEKLIKQFITEIYQKNNYKVDPKSIHFTQIGRKSRAHDLAIEAFRSNRANLRVDYKATLKLLI